MDGIDMQEYLKGKAEVALFKELLRHLPTVQVEDYYKNGKWQNDLMKLDIEIVEAHRREAGAPDPLALRSIPSFEVPVQPKAPAYMLAPLRPISLSAAAGITGTGPVTVPPPAKAQPTVDAATAMGAALAKGQPSAPAGKAAGALVKAPSVVAPASASAAAPAAAPESEAQAPPASWGPADLMQLATFAAKWSVDAARARALLAPLVPERRRYVLQNFELPPGNGGSATTKLEEFLAECESKGTWGASSTAASASSSAAAPAAAAVAPAAAAVGAAPAAAPAAGVKRSLEAAADEAAEPAKRLAVQSASAAGSVPAASDGAESAGPRAMPQLVT